MARTKQTAPRSGAIRSQHERDQLVTELSEVLGVDLERAHDLLYAANEDFDAAVGLHFAQADSQSSPSSGGRPSSRESDLRHALVAMGMPSLTPTQAKRLLSKADNSVDGAVELLCSDPTAAGAPSVAEKRTEEVIVLDSTSQEDAGSAGDDDGSDSEDSGSSEGEEKSEEEAEEEAGPAGAQDAAAPAEGVPGYVPMDAEEPSYDDSFGNASSGFGSGSDDDSGGPLAHGAQSYDEFFNLTAVQHPTDNEHLVMLPSLDDAVYQNARRDPVSTAGLALPLPSLRDRRGRLAAPSSAAVPRKVEPAPEAAPDPSEPLFLGSFDLPLHAINRAALVRAAVAQVGGALEWTPTGSLAYSYVIPSVRQITGSYAEDLSGMISNQATVNGILRGQTPVQLSLGGNDLADAAYFPSGATDEKKLASGPVATVRQKETWVSQAVGALGILNILGAVQVRYVLLEDVDGEVWGLEGAEGTVSKANRATLAKPAAKASTKTQAMRSVAEAAKKLVEEDWEGPKAVRAEVWLTPGALQHLTDTAEGEVPSGLRGIPAGEVKKLKFWGKCSPALAHLLSALLIRGRGLRAGPDSDGLMNYCDSDPAELAATDATPSNQIRKAFNVKNLLDSVALPPSKQLGPNAATVALPRPPGLISTPKRYQLAGLKWMLDRERKGDALGRGHAKLHPAWMQLATPVDGNGAGPRLLYVHRMRTHALSANFYTAPPVGTCGGCICDEMGLGKTLQTLMLVAENPPPSGWAEKKIDSSRTVSHESPIPIKTTLLVAPTTLLGQWEDEIKKHLAPRKLRWGRYVNPLDGAAMRAMREAGGGADEDETDWEAEAAVARGGGGGGGRRPVRARKATETYSPSREGSAAPGANGKKGKGKGSAANAGKQTPTGRRPGTAFIPVLCALPSGAPAPIESLDLCLCSYEDLRDQLASGVGARLSALQQFGFWRVCLDEAQMVANSTSVAAIMASSLWRRHAWCVTGTPVSSNLSEIRGLLEFLALEPVFETDTWGRLVQHGVTAASPRGLGVLRALLRGVMLRRSKADVADELDLPPCTREDVPVVLSTVERTSYERLKREFMEAVRQLRRHQDAATHANRQSEAARAASRAAARAVSALTALRQSTAHPQLAHGGAAMGPTSQRLSMAEIIDRLVAQAYGEYDSTVRALAERRLLAAAAYVVSSDDADADGDGDPIGAAFTPLLEYLDRAAAVAGLFLLDRNACPGLRDADGEVRGGAAAMATVASLAAVDTAEAADEDAELQQARDEHVTTLLAMAQEWDIAHPEQQAKPKAKKKKKKGAAAAKKGGGGGAGGKRKRGAAAEPKGRSKKKARGGRKSQHDSDEEEEEEEWDSDDASDEEAEAAAGAGSDGEEYHPPAPGDGGGDGSDGMDLMELEGQGHGENEAGGSGGAKEKPKGPSMKGRRFARRQLGPRPDLEPRRHALRREAAARRRAWERMKLSALELVLHLRKEEAGLVVGKWSGAAKRVAGARRKSGALEGLWEAAEAAAQAQREFLGLDPSAAAAAAAGGLDAVRRSRRQAGIDAASEMEVVLDLDEIREQLENSVVIVRTYKDSQGGRDPVGQATGHAATAASEASAAYHRLQFVVDQHATATREAAHAAAAGDPSHTAAGTSAGAGTSTGVEQADPNTCPICLDALEESTLAITRCSHKFCGPCIRETLARETPAPCPICRTPLREEDLYEAMSAEEAALAARAAAATNQMTGEYGAKVAAVLDIVATLADTEGPESKAVVFSSWGRALRLVGDALEANGVQFAALAGAAAAKRTALLHDFLNNPSCRVLLVLMSTSGGAAGLTLTAATTAILLEPCVNPGLEAQAAARIHRLGQTRPTRVVRLLAEDTVDAAVVEQQRWKVAAGDSAGVAADEVDHGTVAAIADLLSKATEAGSPAANADEAGPSNARQ